MNKNEKGQALVLMALAFVAMLGFVALAIDGGMIYSDRRFAQNAADAASLAGGAKTALTLENKFVTYGNFYCPGHTGKDFTSVQYAINTGIAAAESRAADNTFTISYPIANKNGVSWVCNDSGMDRYIDIHVMITKATDSIFAHFVYNGPWQNTVDAVTRIRPRTPIAYGNAIVALNDANCSGNSNGVIFGGSGDNTITGSGVFSNGCLKGNGNQFDVTVNNGTVNYVSEATGTLSAISPAPEQAPSVLPTSSYVLDPPDCSSLSNRTQHGDTLDPGIYSTISLTSGDLKLNPGLYCITSSSANAFKVTGGTFTATHVTMYVMNGGVNLSANALITLTAPEAPPDPAPAIAGMMIQLPPGNTNVVSIQGTSASTFIGTIYAPSASIQLAGNNATGTPDGDIVKFFTQVIGYNVMVTGNVDLEIQYDDKRQATLPARLELSK
jgi:hypothetical protein